MSHPYAIMITSNKPLLTKGKPVTTTNKVESRIEIYDGLPDNTLYFSNVWAALNRAESLVRDEDCRRDQIAVFDEDGDNVWEVDPNYGSDWEDPELARD